MFGMAACSNDLKVSSVEPPQGTFGGGEDVVIHGNGFQPGRGGVTVTFGNRPATSVVVSAADKINVMTPGGDPNNYLNKATVILPAVTQPYGNAGRNTATAPGTFQTDVRLQKDFPLKWEKSRMEFRAECYSLLNKTNFLAPNANRSNSNFGTITSAYPARIIQFALRFSF